jgi:hypothetical protein
MATVGNLFVNVRGRTSGFVRDMKRAHKSVRKDFYVNEAMAMQNLRKARERVGFLNLASDERFAAGMKGLRVAEARMAIAAKRPGSRFGTERRRELEFKKAQGQVFVRTAFAGVAAIAGVTVGALAAGVRAATRFASAASARTEPFRYLGPSGGATAGVDVFRKMQQIAAAERPDVSAAKLNKARSMALLEQTGIEYGIMYDNAISTAISVIDDVLNGITSGASTEQLLRSMTGQPSWQQMMRTRAMSRDISGYD